MTPQEQIDKAWKLLELEYKQFWCITSVSWESNNTLIVTTNWDSSGQVRMRLSEFNPLMFSLHSIREGKKRYRKPMEYGPI